MDEGVLSQVEGNLVKWERWHIRTSFNYREGLVLHNVGYEDQGRVRPVLHRASLVEMCVVGMLCPLYAIIPSA